MRFLPHSGILVLASKLSELDAEKLALLKILRSQRRISNFGNWCIGRWLRHSPWLYWCQLVKVAVCCYPFCTMWIWAIFFNHEELIYYKPEYLLSAYCVLGIMLNSRGSKDEQDRYDLCTHKTYVLWGNGQLNKTLSLRAHSIRRESRKALRPENERYKEQRKMFWIEQYAWRFGREKAGKF